MLYVACASSCKRGFQLCVCLCVCNVYIFLCSSLLSVNDFVFADKSRSFKSCTAHCVCAFVSQGPIRLITFILIMNKRPLGTPFEQRRVILALAGPYWRRAHGLFSTRRRRRCRRRPMNLRALKYHLITIQISCSDKMCVCLCVWRASITVSRCISLVSVHTQQSAHK